MPWFYSICSKEHISLSSWFFITVKSLMLRNIFSVTLLPLFTSVLLLGCQQENTQQVIDEFCITLGKVNAGSINTDGLAELEGHTLIIQTLLEVSPNSIKSDLTRIHDTIDNWAGAVSGDQPMIKTFETLSDPKLIGSEGRVTDFIATHCGLDLGGEPWVEANRPMLQETCLAWPRIGTPLTFNNFPNLPDIAGSNYFSNSFIISKALFAVGIETFKGAFVVEPGGRAVMRGQYPKARYFAYHPNDMDLNNLKTLRDIDLTPDEGSVNPYQQVTDNSKENYYTATFVFSPPPTPENPTTNTSYVGARKDGVTDNKFVMNLLRLYNVNAGDVAGSGEVPLPSLSIYDAQDKLVKHYDECDLFAPDVPEISSKQVFPTLPIIDHRPRNPPRWSTSSNFGADSDTLSNADVQYLATRYSSLFGNLLVVRGKYLSAPNTRGGESPAAPGHQVRLYNICTYNFWNGGAIQCILENVLPKDSDDFYTLVVSNQENRPSNLAAQKAQWIDWGPYLDGQLTYRFVYRDNEIVQAIAAAARDEKIDPQLQPYVPKATVCNKETFEQGGWEACFEKAGNI